VLVILYKCKIFFVYSASKRQVIYFIIIIIMLFTYGFFLSIIMAKIIDTFVTKSDKLVGQSNYNVWKLKVINLLLRKDLLDLVEVNTIVTSG